MQQGGMLDAIYIHCIILGVLAEIILIYCLIDDKIRFAPKLPIKLLQMTFVFFVLFGCNILGTKISGTYWIITNTIFTVIVEFCLFMFLIDLSVERLIFLFFLVKNGQDCLYLLSVNIYREGFPILTAYQNLGFRILYLAIVLVAVLLVIFWLSRYLKPLLEAEKDRVDWRIFSIIPLTFFINSRALLYPMVVRNTSSFPVIFTKSLLWVIAFGSVHAALLYMINQRVRMMNLEQELHIKEMQVNIQAERYEGICHSIDNVRKMKHDLRHHIVALNHLLTNGSVEEAKNYLEKFVKSNELEEDISYCDNAVVDALLIYNIHRMKIDKVEYQLSVHLPEKLEVEEDDICTVIANLLENAVDAACRCNTVKRYVEINMEEKGNVMIVLHFKNSYEGTLPDFDKEILSSKGKRKGVGIKSVRRVVEKYNGVINFIPEDSMLTVNVLLGLHSE